MCICQGGSLCVYMSRGGGGGFTHGRFGAHVCSHKKGKGVFFGQKRGSWHHRLGFYLEESKICCLF